MSGHHWTLAGLVVMWAFATIYGLLIWLPSTIDKKKVKRKKKASTKGAEGHCGDGINCHRPKADFCDCYCLRCGCKSSRKGGGAS